MHTQKIRLRTRKTVQMCEEEARNGPILYVFSHVRSRALERQGAALQREETKGAVFLCGQFWTRIFPADEYIISFQLFFGDFPKF